MTDNQFLYESAYPDIIKLFGDQARPKESWANPATGIREARRPRFTPRERFDCLNGLATSKTQ